MMLAVPTAPKQADTITRAESATAAKQQPTKQADTITRAESVAAAKQQPKAQPSPDPIEAVVLLLASIVVAAAASSSAMTVELQPPSLETWLEIITALGLGCGANLLLACAASSPRALIGLCPLLLMVPFGVPYRFGISASAHALISFIGCWKAVDVLAGTRPAAVVSSGVAAYAMHFLSPVEFQIESKGSRADGKSGVILQAGPRLVAGQLVELAARYAGLALVASLASYVATLPWEGARDSLALYADVWTIYLFLSLFSSTFGTALAAAGFCPQRTFAAPLLRTTSLSDFWSRRWNLLIHGLFRRSVFVPLTRGRGVPAWAAGLAAFAISGAFHEYAFALQQPALRQSAGRCALFFLAQAPIVSAEKLLRARMAPPWPMSRSGLACTAFWTLAIVPLAPLFMHPLKTSGVFEQIRTLAPRLHFVA